MVTYYCEFCTLSDMNEKVEALEANDVRSYDVAPPAGYAEFMSGLIQGNA